jgi:hypothetical protein
VKTASERIASSSPCSSSDGTVRGSRLGSAFFSGVVVSGGGVVTGGAVVGVVSRGLVAVLVVAAARRDRESKNADQK